MRVHADAISALVEQTVDGDRRALARLLSVVERGGEPARAAGAALHSRAPDPFTVGLTGAPGAGKSTLTDALVAVVRAGAEAQRVAVVAIDPSSPFTGGAILGDRVRLRGEHAADDGVFMRSLASRGHLGGLARAVPEVVRVLGAAGWPVVFVETVGVGQTEMEVAAQADTTVVVVTPGWGDEVQANKAGLLEVADVLVVNKADRDGAAMAVRDLRRMLDLAGERDWRPPIVSTVAVDGTGAEQVWVAVREHREHLAASGGLERHRRARLVTEVRGRVSAALEAAVASAERSAEGRALLSAVTAGELSPAEAVERLLVQVRDEAGEGR